MAAATMRATASWQRSGKAAAVVVVTAGSDEDGGEDGVKILAGKCSPEKKEARRKNPPEKSAGKSFPGWGAAAVRQGRWPAGSLAGEIG
ncbi:hypothetical protein Tco_0875453 [Tanacetum coccineum]|uniref:Uncharacterized protein n=1 Tax=Tanacetum coccineum TaxID=301880 RepID=A0ABQ5BSB0_9ASTR